LTRRKEADILVTHVRCEMPPHIEAERTTEFLTEYPLVILGDLHSKYSPGGNAHYTNSPYSINFSSSKPNGSYIQLDIDDEGYEWKYVDLDLPQKVKFSGKASDFREFKPDPHNLYRVVVEDTLEELRTLPYHKNVMYSKIIKHVIVEAEEIPESTELIDLLVTRVVEANSYDTRREAKTRSVIDKLIT